MGAFAGPHSGFLTADLPGRDKFIMLVSLALIGAFFISFTVSGLLSRHAGALLLDQPVARSAHESATPRGGGLSVVVAIYVFLTVMYTQGLVSVGEIAVLLCAVPVALAGLADDLRSLPVKLRLSIHLSAAALALYLLGPVPEAFFSGLLELPAFVLALLLIVALVWLLNLYNFMDGIDMLAAGQCLFVSGVATLLLFDADDSLAWVCAGLFIATLGFMYWNLPPARLFMGDTGSTFLGFFLGLLGLLTHYAGTLSVWAWVLLMGGFIADTTCTLLRRLLSRQRVTEAHSTHAYQHLARRLKSHSKAAAAMGAVNVFWLLPFVWLAVTYPEHGVVWAISGIVPLMLVAAVLGAGTVVSNAGLDNGPGTIGTGAQDN
jgi:Fuc2NAc and GlcNAc transferase